MNLSITEHREQFLTTLFDGLPGAIEIRSFPAQHGPPRQTFCDTIGQAMDAVLADYAAGFNVYAGMATRGEKLTEDGRRSGGKDNLVACRTLWVDRDGLYIEGAREVWEVALEQFALTPSMRVDSGGGEHSYWLLEEPIELTTPEPIELLEHTLKGLADVLECDPSATDASRILRVPGTLNIPNADKRSRGRVEAKCRLTVNTGELLSLDDFEAFTERGRKLKNTAPKTTAPRDGEAKTFGPNSRHEALKRHAAFLRKSGLSIKQTEAALLVFNQERCDPPKDDAEVVSLARWAACIEMGDHNAREVEPDTQEAKDYVEWLRKELVSSVTDGKPLEVVELDFSRAKLAPRYPSSVEGLEVYGNTVVLADAGVGKSLLTIGMAIEAASCGGWEVVYFNAELDQDELAVRVKRYADGRMAPPALRHISWVAGGDRTTVQDMVEACVQAVTANRRLLVVIDSINTFAEFAADDSPGSDLAQTRRLYNWATQVRKNTLGDVSFVLVSETNAGGGVKGRKGFFSADVVVKIEGSENPEMVEMNVLKSRSAKGGNLGKYVREWKFGRFVR